MPQGRSDGADRLIATKCRTRRWSGQHPKCMHVLVIGGRGALGRHVCRELARRGQQVTSAGRGEPLVRADVIVNCAGASVAMGLGHGWRGYPAVDVPIGLAAIEAARRDRARLVYVAAFHPPALRGCAYIAAHERVAAAMREVDGIVVRATGFFSAFAAMLPLARRGWLADVGDGQARINPIAETDLAAIVADIAVGRDGPRDVAAGGPQVLRRREAFELVAAAAGRRVRIVGVPRWLARLGTLALRPLHPRIAQFASFACGLSKHDAIAPALGTTRLEEYLRDLAGTPAASLVIDERAHSRRG